MSAPRVAVVHLVREANGSEPFDAFLSSYERHDAGREHDLVLLCKGFAGPEAMAAVRRRAGRLAAAEVHVDDDGLDLTAYMAAARELAGHERLCFVNSYTTILAPAWLRLLSDALDAPGAGVAAATGSWGSHRSFALSLLRLPNGYRGTLGDRRAMAPAFQSVGTAPRLSRPRRLAKAALDLPREIAGHPGFPAPHVRTNAFVIRARAARVAEVGPARFQSGRLPLRKRDARAHRTAAGARARGARRRPRRGRALARDMAGRRHLLAGHAARPARRRQPDARVRGGRAGRARGARALRLGPASAAGMTAPRTAVVHLVWGPAGLAPFDTFASSYERHDAGCEHDLVLLYNGFDDEAERAAHDRRAEPLEADEIVLAEPCLDLAAYVAAARQLGHERVCFVNSYSEILVPGWLGLLDGALADPAAGAAGATGSWASHLSYGLYQLGLGGSFARALGPRKRARDAMHAIAGADPPNGLAHWLYTLMQVARHGRGGARFPAPHLRTNAFLVDRERFLALAAAPLRSKWDTYRLESGQRSLTARLRAAGTPPVVVDAAGVARRPEDWHRGDVFFQSRQQDLLVADNQTRSYDAASADQRAVLSAFAWGEQAR